MRIRIAFVVLILLAAISLTGVQARAQDDRCSTFEDWIGGKAFDYRVDKDGNWNFPADTVERHIVFFPNSALWDYWSESEQAEFVIIFLDLEPTQPAGSRFGQHHLCVIRVAYDA